MGLVAALVAANALSAQTDITQSFEEGVKQLRLGNRQQALEKFAEVLKADPSNEAAFELWKKTDQDIWRMLLNEQEDVSKIARHLLGLAQIGRKKLGRDEAKIKELVDKACAGDFDTRRTAINSLVGEHGEFAVPALVEKLANSDDDKGQTHAILALHYIGRSATLPLVEALHSENMLVRRNCAAALSHIRDLRSAAGLARLVQTDDNEGVRLAAKKALETLVHGGINAVDLYLADGRRYLAGMGVQPGEGSEVVWSLEKGKLVPTDVPPALYSLELARRSGHEAFLLDPASDAAKILLAESCLAEVALIGESKDDAVKAWAGRTPVLQMMAMMTGPKILNHAIADAIKAGMPTVAAAAIRALGQVQDPSGIGESELVKALDSTDKRICYAAAIALTSASKGRPMQASAKVVERLGQAITEEVVRVIKIIDSDPTAGKVAEAVSQDRVNVVEADTSGIKAINRLRQFPHADVIVVNEKIADALPQAVIGLLRNDPRFANTKILLVAEDPDKAKADYGDKIHGVIKGPLTADQLQKSVDEALKDVPLDGSKQVQNEIAVAASKSLAELGASKVDLGSALGNLCLQLDRKDDVAIPAAEAIGQGGSIAQVQALVDVVKKEAASPDLRAAGATAIGNILGRSNAPEAPDAALDALLAVLDSNADLKVKSAVSAALGKGKFPPGKLLKMVEKMRATPADAAATKPADEAKAGEAKAETKT
jgi:HEAT repeat protein